MSEPEVKTINRGGRPRKYQSLAEYKAASKAARVAKRDAKRATPLPAPPAIEVPADAPAVQVTIATAVASLTMQESIFVTEVCSGASLTQAYKKAFPNAAESTAHTAGSVFAAKPHIAKALATVKAGLAATVAYDFSKFMTEMTDAMTFAKDTKNATALVRAVELRGKATGHLSDKPQGPVGSGFTLNIVGVESPITLERADV